MIPFMEEPIENQQDDRIYSDYLCNHMGKLLLLPARNLQRNSAKFDTTITPTENIGIVFNYKIFAYPIYKLLSDAGLHQTLGVVFDNEENNSLITNHEATIPDVYIIVYIAYYFFCLTFCYLIWNFGFQDRPLRRNLPVLRIEAPPAPRNEPEPITVRRSSRIARYRHI